jgi:hypothetical protein
MNDWVNAADGVAVTGFAPANEVTVRFDDKTVIFPMPTASTVADLARRVAAEGGSQRRQMCSVTVKLGGANRLRTPVAAVGNAMTSHHIRAAVRRSAKRRAAQRVLVVIVAALSPLLAILLAGGHF